MSGADHAALDLIEPAPNERIRINPLGAYSTADFERYFTCHDLPRHPLVARGFRSIGYQPYTAPVRAREPVRVRHWPPGSGNTECGIHLPQRIAMPEQVTGSVPV
jgi:phosphoadenosine phosphosulfate reductase